MNTAFNPLNHMAGGAPVASPPSFVPSITSLSGMMDAMLQKRMAIANMERQQQLADQQAQANANKDTYYRGRLAAQDRRDSTAAKAARVRSNIEQQNLFRKSPGAGTFTYTDPDTGEVHAVQPMLEGAEPPVAQEPQLNVPPLIGAGPMRLREPFAGSPPAEQAPPTPPQGGVFTMMGKPVVPPAFTAMSMGPGGQPQPDRMFVDEVSDGEARVIPETQGEPGDVQTLPQMALPEGAREGQRFQAADVNLRGGYGNPHAAPPQRSVFVDEMDDGTARVLTGDQEMDLRQLPAEALPEGAREGQRFSEADVNLRGGKGNPFAEPLPPNQTPPVQRQEMPETLDLAGPRADSVQVPPPVVRGDVHQQAPGRRWVAKLPNGERWMVDVDQMEREKAAESRALAENMTRAIDDPNTPPEAKKELIVRRALIVSGLPAKAGSEMYQQTGKLASIDAQGQNAIDLEGERQGGRVELEVQKQKGRIDLKRTPKAGGGGAKGSNVSGTGDNPWARLNYKERNPTGMRLAREQRDWATQHGWTKLLSTNPGRLEWALANIKSSDGAAQVEAMQNLFGAARGGTPVKNETDEFYKGTRSLKNMLDSAGAAINMPQLGTKLANGQMPSFSKENYSALPPDRRQSIEHAINSTAIALIGWGQRDLATLKTKWNSEPVEYRYKATDLINELGAHLGMDPKQWWTDVPLRSEGAGPGAQGKGGGMTLEQGIQALLKAKQGGK